MGFAPHIRETYTCRRYLPFLFLVRQPYSLNGNSHLDRNASIDVDLVKVVPFGGVEICEQNFRGHICPQKLKNKVFTPAQT
jgi:hypothetical protein